jgi:allantoin racemase
MKIKIIVPVATDKWNKGALELCREIADCETEISISNIEKGPVSIESVYDETYANPFVVDAAKKAEKEGYDGIIIYCFSNPALYAVREAIKIPVIGIGEAAHIFGMVVGERIGIISTIENSVPRHWRKAKILGTISKLKAIKPLNLPVLEYNDKEKVMERVKKVATELIEKEKVDTIILGCGSMLGIKKELQDTFPVPIIIPGEAAIKLIESMVKMGISHSKITYMYPPEKEYIV